MVDIVGLYSELLLDASFAGIPFCMPDSRHAPGRRVVRFMFPGADVPQFQDLGQNDEEISVTGLIVSDDYIEQAQLLRAAMLTPGPNTLQHPWLGEIMVMLAPGRAPSFSFSQSELRVARFQVSFVRYAPPPPPTPDTLGALLLTLDQLRSAGDALLADILAPAAMTIAAISAVEQFAGDWIGTWTQAVGALVDAPASIAAGIAGLGGVDALTTNSTYQTNVATALSAPSSAVLAAAAPAQAAAVAPSGAVTPATPLDARAATTAILAAVTGATPAATATTPATTVALAAQALAVADAVQTSTAIAFTSQQEATEWAQLLTAALTAATTLAAATAAQQPRSAGDVWRALMAAQAALSTDMVSVIGRLPAVVQFTVPHTASVWQIAQALSGDTPSLVVATYLDIVARNDILNPGAVPPGILEVLQP